MRAGRYDAVRQNQYIRGLWRIDWSTVHSPHNHGGNARLQHLLHLQIPLCSFL